eukprot:TRINITY_DN641_c1_g3_i4.p1 TRINITY_DN641_c1_g3~~TRINITY_DN641_c1_g3_i4.p1  ORF type:complete len:437 (-),score=90.78 TRINITY_DN641_c1_g3_i4:27-1337(-)
MIIDDYVAARSTFMTETLSRSFGITLEEMTDSLVEGDTKEKEKQKIKAPSSKKMNFQNLVPRPNDKNAWMDFLEFLTLLIVNEREITEKIFPDPEIFPLAFGGEIQKVLQLFNEASTFVCKAIYTEHDSLLSAVQFLPMIKQSKAILNDNLVKVLSMERPPTRTVRPECECFFTYFEDVFYKHYMGFLKNSTSKVFEYFLNNKTTETIKPQPDASIHTVVVNTMNFLHTVSEYKRVIAADSLLRVDVNGTFGSYVILCIENLHKNIIATRKEGSLYTIFQLNNYHYIYKQISEKEAISSELPPEVIQKYKQIYLELFNSYFKCWDKVLTDLGPNFKPSKHWGVTQKPAKQVKERFITLNAELAELFESQKKLTIEDDNLREQVKDKIKELVLPPYKKCLDDYGGTNFCKPKKRSFYIKYTAETLETMINEFFSLHC